MDRDEAYNTELRQAANATIESELVRAHIDYQDAARILLDDPASGDVNIDVQFEPEALPGTEVGILVGLSPAQARELAAMLSTAADVAESYRQEAPTDE